MCVFVAPAQCSGTVVYIGRHSHPEHGPIEILGYQVTGRNLAASPNAMLLHLPAVEMTQEQFLDTTDAPDVLRDLVDALGPAWTAAAGGAVAPAAAEQAAEVFDRDVYTVVLARDPRDIPAALLR